MENVPVYRIKIEAENSFGTVSGDSHQIFEDDLLDRKRGGA